MNHCRMHESKITRKELGIGIASLTPNRPVIHTCFTYPILNMGDFSALYGPLGCIDSTQKVKGNSLHAEEGIGKKGKIVTIYATL